MVILHFIKKQVEVYYDDTAFDDVLLNHINSVGATLSSIGVSEFDTLEIFTNTKFPTFEIDGLHGLVKGYMSAKVKLMFDPPSHGALLESLTKIAKELEFRIMVAINDAEVVV